MQGQLHVLDDQIIKEINNHTHAVNRGEVQASKVRQEMKKHARETEETPQQIISIAVAHLNDHAAVTTPAVHHIRRDIRRQRKRAGNPIPVPQAVIWTATRGSKTSSKTTTTVTCSIFGA